MIDFCIGDLTEKHKVHLIKIERLASILGFIGIKIIRQYLIHINFFFWNI
jgi:hypothetical protein